MGFLEQYTRKLSSHIPESLRWRRARWVVTTLFRCLLACGTCVWHEWANSKPFGCRMEGSHGVVSPYGLWIADQTSVKHNVPGWNVKCSFPCRVGVTSWSRHTVGIRLAYSSYSLPSLRHVHAAQGRAWPRVAALDPDLCSRRRRWLRLWRYRRTGSIFGQSGTRVCAGERRSARLIESWSTAQSRTRCQDWRHLRGHPRCRQTKRTWPQRGCGLGWRRRGGRGGVNAQQRSIRNGRDAPRSWRVFRHRRELFTRQRPTRVLERAGTHSSEPSRRRK